MIKTIPSVTVNDAARLHAPVDRVWAALLDFSSYRRWWPWLVQVKVLRQTHAVIGSRFRVRPMGGPAFVCEVHDISPLEMMTIRYVRGAYEGFGRWQLAPMGDATLIQYEIDLHIRSRLVRWLGRWLDVAGMHSHHMRQLLLGLEKFAGRRPQATAQPQPQPVIQGEQS